MWADRWLAERERKKERGKQRKRIEERENKYGKSVVTAKSQWKVINFLCTDLSILNLGVFQNKQLGESVIIVCQRFGAGIN